MSAVQLFSDKIKSGGTAVISDSELLGLMIEKDVNKARIDFLIYQALIKDKINPDSVLVITPQVALTSDGLIPFAMALKNKADPNSYVKVEGKSTMHIIPFILGLGKEEKFNIVSDSGIVEEFLILLLLSGSDLQSPYLKQDPNKRISPNVRRVYMDIGRQGFTTNLFEENNYDPDEIMRALQSPKYDRYRTMLDEVSKYQDTLETAKLCVRFFSPSVFDLQTKSRREHGDKLVNLAVEHYNSMAYNKLLSWGFLPSYYLVNSMLLEIRLALKQKDLTTAQLLEDMLVSAVDHSLRLDVHQVNLAGAIDPNFRSVLEKSYEVPYWRKVCKTRDGMASRELQALSASLNLPVSNSKAAICSNLDKAADTNRDEFIEASQKRQNEIFSGELSTVGDYVGGSSEYSVRLAEDIDASNMKMPSIYNDSNIAVYRDEQGGVWFYDSGEFESLLATKTNPQTGAFLPEEFLTRLEAKTKLLKSLGVMEPVSYETVSEAGVLTQVDKAFDRFQEPDRVSPSGNKADLERFYNIAQRYNVSRTLLTRASVEQLRKALPGGYGNARIDLLGDKSYALVTVAKIIDQESETARREFFSNIRSEMQK